MKYEIIGGSLPALECELNAGESVFTESGGMSWMDDKFDMSSNTKGGIMKGLGRALAGESIFLTTYTAKQNNAKITFASCFPGNILPLELKHNESIIAQKHAFLAAEDGVELEMYFRKKLGVGFFGGEGFILQKIKGPGMAFLEIDGSIVEKTLAPNEVLKVDQGYIAAFEPTVRFDIETIKGLGNILFSGEGLFVGTLTGPGKVWLQTMPYSKLATQILSMVPSK